MCIAASPVLCRTASVGLDVEEADIEGSSPSEDEIAVASSELATFVFNTSDVRADPKSIKALTDYSSLQRDA